MTKKKDRDEKGRFLEGNNIGVGRNPIFETPKELETACMDYFKWADNNPWIKNDVVRGGDSAGKVLKIAIQRPYTLIGLCQHIGIDASTWYEYEKKDGFSQITTRVRDKIDNQQFEGAMVGIFNASLTARRLGLSDKHQHEGGDPNKPIKADITTKVIFEDYSKKNESKD